MIYFDAATTLKPNDEVVSRATKILSSSWGNVSGSHSISREAKSLLEESREKVSETCDVKPENIVFTSGATDALNIVLQGYSRLNPQAKIYCSRTEHDAVYKTAEYLDAEFIDVDDQGKVLLQSLSHISIGDLVCVMAVNNETGVLQDIETISAQIHERGGLLLVDAVQSYYSFDAKDICSWADYIVFSGHKLGALQGVGVLVIKDRKSVSSLMFGGSQEWEIRPGTTPAYLCDAFANVFCEKYSKEVRNYQIEKVKKFRDSFESLLSKQVEGIVFNSSSTQRSAHISSIKVNSIESQMLVAMLDENGICVSKGSACASGASTPSHVLTAMGMSADEALSTIRVSFSTLNTEDEIKDAVNTFVNCIETLRSFNSKKAVTV